MTKHLTITTAGWFAPAPGNRSVKAAVLPLSKLGPETFKIYGLCPNTLYPIMTIQFNRQEIPSSGRDWHPSVSPTILASANDGCVTVRERDTMEQERIPVDKVVEYITERIFY